MNEAQRKKISEFVRNHGTIPLFVGSNAQWALHTDRGQGVACGREKANRGKKERDRGKRERKRRIEEEKRRKKEDALGQYGCTFVPI
jgi:hypothetical protein